MKYMFRFMYITALLNLFSFCAQKSEPVICLIPEGYKGSVKIIFNQNGTPIKYKNIYGRDTVYTPQIGSPVKYENGKRIYEIPSNGILLTQFEPTYGFDFNKNEYYYVNASGSRKKINIVHDYEVKEDKIKDKNEVSIYNQTFGTMGNVGLIYIDFVVSSYTDLNTVYGKEYNDDFLKRVKEVLKYDF